MKAQKTFGRSMALVGLLWVVFIGPARTEPIARNVILMIGDGMGYEQVRLTELVIGRALEMTQLPVRGALRTHSADQTITDSAAAGTAMACGRKTRNGMLGMLPDGTPVPSVAELARDAGRRVGILTSVPINHATPAAFYAKAASRASYHAIGRMAIESRFDVLGGSTFVDAEGPPPLWDLANRAGYAIVRSPTEFDALPPGARRIILVAQQPVRDPDSKYGDSLATTDAMNLAAMVTMALARLDGAEGFFLMVEGGAIDWAGHENDAAYLLDEMLAFDEAVRRARTFAQRRKDTLLIVTSDHETGGLRIRENVDPRRLRARLSPPAPTLRALQDWLLHRVATGESVGGEHGWPAFRAALGLELRVDNASALDELSVAYERLLRASGEARRTVAREMARQALRVRDRDAGIDWTSLHHTAVDVPLWAEGPGADRFSGTQDNTAIFHHIVDLLGLGRLGGAVTGRTAAKREVSAATLDP